MKEIRLFLVPPGLPSRMFSTSLFLLAVTGNLEPSSKGQDKCLRQPLPLDGRVLRTGLARALTEKRGGLSISWRSF